MSREFTENPVCPYCGYEERDSWELEDGLNTCGRCLEEYELESYAVRYFRTTKVAQHPAAEEA